MGWTDDVRRMNSPGNLLNAVAPLHLLRMDARRRQETRKRPQVGARHDETHRDRRSDPFCGPCTVAGLAAGAKGSGRPVAVFDAR